MGPWEVTGNVAAILVAVVLGAVAVGAVAFVGARRRRRDTAEHMPDEGLLREQSLERLRQVQAQWEGRAVGGPAEPAGQEPPAPTEHAPGRPPTRPSTPDTKVGPAHVGSRPRRGRTASIARTVVAVIVLAVVVGAALFWLTRP